MPAMKRGRAAPYGPHGNKTSTPRTKKQKTEQSVQNTSQLTELLGESLASCHPEESSPEPEPKPLFDESKLLKSLRIEGENRKAVLATLKHTKICAEEEHIKILNAIFSKKAKKNGTDATKAYY
jgi:hypothetical protein